MYRVYNYLQWDLSPENYFWNQFKIQFLKFYRVK